MKEFIGAVTVILSLVGLIPYIVDIFRGKTKPHVFTWLVWAIITLLAFVAQWQQGGGAGSWTTFITGLLTIVIALLSFKYGSKDITTSDKVIFAGALISIIPWLLTKDPTLSVIILTIIDAAAFIPTIRKTNNDPTSETLSTQILNVFRHSLSIVALGRYSIATFFYPLVLAIMNAIVVFVIVRPRPKKA